jgi:hypothetical protein
MTLVGWCALGYEERAMRVPILTAVLVALLTACSTEPRVPDPWAGDGRVGRAAVAPESGASPALDVFATDQRTSGSIMKLRGAIRNPTPDTVDGVRMLLRVYSGSGTSGQLRETLQRELDLHIPPGGSSPFHWDPQSVYFGQTAIGTDIRAYPKRLGSQEMPPPEGWRP